MSAIASILSGSLLGLTGSIGSAVIEFMKQKEKNKHELQVLASQRDAAVIAANNQVSLETLKVLQGSYEQDSASYWKPGAPTALLVVDVARGITRPVITWYLVILASYIGYSCLREIEMSVELMRKVAEYSIYACLELCAMCVTWWFGSRSFTKIKQ